MIKIAAIYDVSFPFIKGGGQRRLFEVMSRLNNQDNYSFFWFTYKAWPQSKNVLDLENITYKSIGRLPNLYNADGKRSKTQPLNFVWNILRNIKSIGENDIVWVAQWPLLHLIPICIFKLVFKYKIVVDYWEVWPYSSWRKHSFLVGTLGFLFQQMIVWVISQIAEIVTDSEIEKQKIIGINKRARVTIIPNGVPFELIGNVTNEKKRKYDIVYFGRLKDHKNVEMLLESLSLLQNDKHLKIKTLIIGDGPMKKILMDMSNNFNLKNIRFTGFIENQKEVYELIKESKIGIIPITNGGGAGNLTLLELNACGTPCIIFDVEDGIDGDIVEDGINGFKVKDVSAYGLAEKIKDFLSNYKSNIIIHNSTLEFSKRFSWDSSSKKYKNVFKRISNQ
jgi:L-malate glycosyltransferase